MQCVSLCLNMSVVSMQFVGLRNAKPEMCHCLAEEKQILARGIVLSRFDDIYFFGKEKKK